MIFVVRYDSCIKRGSFVLNIYRRNIIGIYYIMKRYAHIFFEKKREEEG